MLARSQAILNPAQAGRGRLPARWESSSASGRLWKAFTWSRQRLSLQIADRAVSDAPEASRATTLCIWAATPTAPILASGLRAITASILATVVCHHRSEERRVGKES